MPPSKLITGLGNPGEKYARTRHNCGWIVLDEVAREVGPLYESEKWSGLLGEKGDFGLFKPLTYMNRSGIAVGRLLRGLDCTPADLLVVSDDLNLDLGRIRVRPGGSSGGHNGLQSVIENLGTEEFARLRIGIGPVPDGVPGRAFVLGRFTRAEENVLERVVAAARDAALCWVAEGEEAAMERFNGFGRKNI